MQMVDQHSLGSSVQLSPISIATKCEIIRHLWVYMIDPTEYHANGNLDLYFAYYTDQYKLALRDAGRHNLVRTHKDIIDIAGHIKSAMDRAAIIDILRLRFTTGTPDNEEEILNSTLDLVTRLLLMMEFGTMQFGFIGRSQLDWKDGTLKSKLAEYFGSHQILDQEDVKLERVFNARNLRRIAGIEIVWTKSLADHLKLTDDDKKVMIFHHVSFLNCQKNKYASIQPLQWGVLTLAVTYSPLGLWMRLYTQ